MGSICLLSDGGLPSVSCVTHYSFFVHTPNELAHTCARTRERLADRTATPRGGGHPALVCHRVIKACVRPRVRSCGAWLDL